MKFGLTQSQYDFINSTVFNPVLECGGSLWCFGSRARGDYKKFSDLDLLIVGESTKLPDLIGSLTETLQESNFPFKVDLVLESRLAKSYLKDIDLEKVLW